MTPPYDGVKLKILQRARPVFLAESYRSLTMTMLATTCGLTRRGLYHHFSSKDDIFRAMLRWGNQEANARADWAARKTMARGEGALATVAEWLDSRFGAVRRDLMRSVHGAELNETAFRIGNDLMIEAAHDTNAALVKLLAELEGNGDIRLKPHVSVESVAQLLADGARGVNQQRPPAPPSEIRQRYHAMTQAILFGCAENPGKS